MDKRALNIGVGPTGKDVAEQEGAYKKRNPAQFSTISVMHYDLTHPVDNKRVKDIETKRDHADGPERYPGKEPVDTALLLSGQNGEKQASCSNTEPGKILLGKDPLSPP